MNSFGNLNDDELREKLNEYGISSPVTATTRGVLVKKLNNAIAASKKNQERLRNGFSPGSGSKRSSKRKQNFALSNFSSDEDDNDDSDISGPKTRLRSFRNGNDSSLLEYNTPPRRKLSKSYDNYEDLSNNSSSLDSSVNKNDNCILSNISLSRGRLLRRRRSEIDKSISSNQYGSFSDSEADEPKPKFVDRPKRDEPDNPCTYYKNFKLFDMKEDKRNLPVVSKVSKNSQRGTEIRIIHNNKVLSPEEIISQEIPNYQNVLPNGMNSPDNKDNSFEENTWSQSVSIVLLVLCVCFFLFVGLCYINIQTSFVSPLSFVMAMTQFFSQWNDVDGTNQISTARMQHLNIHNTDKMAACSDSINKPCLSENEYAALPKILQVIEETIVPELIKHASRYQCGREKERYIKITDIASMFRTHLPSVDRNSLVEGLNGFAKLVSQNPDFNLETIWDAETSEPAALAIFPLPSEYLCYIFFILYSIIYHLAAVFIVISAAWLLYQMLRYRKRRFLEQEQKSFELVEQILEMLENSCVAEGKNFIAVNHIRDCLISPRDRKAKSSLWNRAVKFIDEHDSRVYREIRLVGGDECQVWRWVAGAPRSPALPVTPIGTPGSVEKSWQGKAFNSVETPQNFPSVSPTACLKVRKMFDAELVFGKDWPERVQDNLLQKCEHAKILHVAVDKESKEGCVYVKCASPHDAGIAFRALHGTWYDGNLVTVKYLREEKYHERFPTSRTVDTFLRHGNNSVRMMQRR